MNAAQEGQLVEHEPQPMAVAVTPMQMIAQAVAQGADVDKLAKLMDLQERWQKEEARKAFVQALNAFKADPPEIFKNKSVSHNGKFMYKHATLDNVSGAIGASLAKVGISHRWDTEQLEGGLIRVTCVLTHEMGHSERVPLQASPDQSGSKNAIQAVGSTVHYLMRYTLLAATGMAVADGTDDDGRQGKMMSDDQVQAFEDRISQLTDEKAAAILWQQVTQATTAAGDVESYEHFRGLMAAKRKELHQQGGQA